MKHAKVCSSERSTTNLGNRLRMIVLALAACGLMLAGTTESADAQCPTGWLPGSYVTTMTICGGIYQVQVNFCYATNAVVPSRQYIITKIKVISGTPPCNISSLEMRALAKKLIEENPANYKCDQGTCPYIIPEWRTSYAPCWRNATNGQGQVEMIPCGGGGGCVDLFIVCCDCDDQMTAYYSGSQQTDQCGTSEPPGCYQVCGPPGTPDPVGPCE